MRKVRQLKESLLGWGGYKDVQDLIYLDKKVIYMRGGSSTSTESITGTFHTWTATVDNTTYTYYTRHRNPEFGDRVFKDGAITRAVVAQYNTSDDTIQVWTTSAPQYAPDVTVKFSYVGLSGQKSFNTTVYTYKIYFVNIDGTQNDKVLTYKIDYYDECISNEYFFFDKQTQCLVRTAFSEVGPRYGTSDVPAFKQMMFTSFDPNTLEVLDNHVVWGHSRQRLGQKLRRRENVSQGYYSFYCSPMAELFVYSPRYKRVFDIKMDSLFPNLPTSTATDDIACGIYNRSRDLDNLTDMCIGMYINESNTQKFYSIKANLESHPYDLTIENTFTLNSSTNPFQYQEYWDLYPNFPFTTSSMAFANTSSLINKVVNLNKCSSVNSSTTSPEESTVKHYVSDYSASLVLPSYDNSTGGTFGVTMLPTLSSSGWEGRLSILINQFTSASGYTQTLSRQLVSTIPSSPVTNTNYYPRFFTSPKKIMDKPKVITETGTVAIINGVTFTKSYADECLACIVENTYLDGVAIVSKTVNGATGYDSVDTTPKVRWTFIYNGETYYLGLFANRQSHGSSLTNPMNLPILTINEQYASGYNTPNVQIIGTMILDAYYGTGYETPIFIKDYYNDGNNTLVYKLDSFDRKTKITAYDGVYGSEVSVIKNEFTRIPVSETSMVFCSVSQLTSSSYSRYLNLLTVEYDSTNRRLVPITTKIDCNRNTRYASENIPNLSSGGDGGFGYPPVAIADGILQSEIIEYPENYYAWKRTASGTTTFIFTNSLDAGEVVGTVYYFKDNLNNFYREVESTASIITSMTSTYLTTQNGYEYTRISDYDWSLEHSTMNYVPSHLKGWRA